MGEIAYKCGRVVQAGHGRPGQPCKVGVDVQAGTVQSSGTGKRRGRGRAASVKAAVQGLLQLLV